MNRLYINKDWSTLKKLIAIKAAGGGAPMVEYTATGNPATFETNVAKPMELLIPFNPVQDLHGYDSPWPAGGGKNLFNKDGTYPDAGKYLNSSGAVVDSANWTITYIPVTVGLKYSISGIVAGVTSAYFWWADANKDSLTVIGLHAANAYDGITAPENAAYIAISWISNTENASYDGKTLQVEQANSHSTYAPYSNLCPISGWDSANVSRTGKNLLDLTALHTYSNWKTDITTSGESSGQTESANRGFILPTVPGETYTLSFDFSNAFPNYLYLCKSINGYGTRVAYITTTSVNIQEKTFTTDDNEVWFIRMGNTGTESLFNTNVEKIGSPQLELGSTASEYTPYSGTTAEYEFPQEAKPVYGGKRTIHKDGTGTLVVDKVFTVWTGDESESYTRDSGTYGYRFRRIYSDADQSSGRKQIMCNAGTFAITENDVGVCFLNVGYIYYYPPKDITTADEFKTWLASNNLAFVYPLATPVTYQLTNQQVIETLKGVNNVWSDTNGVNTIKYKKRVIE